jgi:TPP-dependent pyruvate/acetoin dehydrogenase alpha subunit
MKPLARKKSIPHAKLLIAQQRWMTALPGVTVDGDDILHSKEESRS